MKNPTRLFTWKTAIRTSIVLLLILIASNFYGLLTDTFHYNKIDSYLFAALTIVHFVYLYAVWYKITENEYPDKEMRNLEYCFYVVFAVYLYKIVDIASVLFSYNTFNNFVLPEHFIPVGAAIVSIYVVLCIITLQLFSIRKKRIGDYATDCFSDEDLNTWP